jgi:arsenate reductase
VTAEPIRVLFVCTGNSARSILAEAVLRQAGHGRFAAASAGTHPAGIHPLTLRVLDEAGIDAAALRSKSIDEFAGAAFDYVITLCDDARAICPVFPGADQSLHWGYRDPAGVEGTEAERLEAFRRVLSAISERVRQFVTIAERPDRVRA